MHTNVYKCYRIERKIIYHQILSSNLLEHHDKIHNWTDVLCFQSFLGRFQKFHTHTHTKRERQNEAKTQFSF